MGACWRTSWIHTQVCLVRPSPLSKQCVASCSSARPLCWTSHCLWLISLRKLAAPVLICGYVFEQRHCHSPALRQQVVPISAQRSLASNMCQLFVMCRRSGGHLV
jgi:hypothetical protein